MKKLLKTLFLISVIFGLFAAFTLTVSAQEVASGTCGDNHTWTLDDVGTLTISGTGEMYNYPLTWQPWDDWRENIKKVVIEDGVTTVGNNAFNYYYNITSVTIPSSVTYIRISAFEACAGITNITIPDGVTKIGSSVFRDCINLTGITIPSSVTSIDGDAFYNCASLNAITVDANNPNYSSDINGVLFNKEKTILKQYPIGNKRTTYEIPDSVNRIVWPAFTKCQYLTSVTIPNSVTTIDSAVFYGCSALAEVTFSKSITSIGNNVFGLCTALETVYFIGSEEQWNEITIDSTNSCLEDANIICMPMHIVIDEYNIGIAQGSLTGDISLDVYNAEDDKTVRAIVAAYDVNGNFIGMTSGYITVAGGDSNVHLDLLVPVDENQNSGYVKVFFWDNLVDLTPYSRCKGFEF